MKTRAGFEQLENAKHEKDERVNKDYKGEKIKRSKDETMKARRDASSPVAVHPRCGGKAKDGA